MTGPTRQFIDGELMTEARRKGAEAGYSANTPCPDH
jgi:hypothetical protein